MNYEYVMRCTLIIGALFNLFAAIVVAFPDCIGKFAGLPVAGPRFYSWMLALFIAIFGGVYAWLARHRRIDRPLVVVAAIGKFGVFNIALICWQVGDISAKAVGSAVGDLIFGFIFLWWLRRESQV